jgi:hypothetical protein
MKIGGHARYQGLESREATKPKISKSCIALLSSVFKTLRHQQRGLTTTLYNNENIPYI